MLKDLYLPFPRDMLEFDPAFAIGLPKEVTTSGDVVDPTIWIDTGFLIRDIGDGAFCVDKCVRIKPEDDPVDLTGLMLSGLFRKLGDWELRIWRASGRPVVSELNFCLDWRSVLVCCRFTRVCAASNSLASSGGASLGTRSGNVGRVREFIGRICCCLVAYELFNFGWPRTGEIKGTNGGRCIKFWVEFLTTMGSSKCSFPYFHMNGNNVFYGWWSTLGTMFWL